MGPLKLIPAFKDYLWGGEKLKTEFKMKTDKAPVAEAWVLSAHPDGQSTIVNGEFAGKTFGEVLKLLPKAALGTNCEKFKFFPILIKLIDALDNLSIQVHPNDEYALAAEGEYGKTEMWYVVDCEPGAYIYYGFNKTITKEEFKSRIEDNSLIEVLNKVEVKKGDCFMIEAGTLHAICKGLLIAEIQQNSNTTYRIFDYGRTDAEGNPRMLHTSKAIDVTSTTKMENKPVDNSDIPNKLLAKNQYFTTNLLNVETTETIFVDETSFASVLVIEGTGTVSCDGIDVEFVAGDCLFITANSGNVTIGGKSKIIITRI